MYRPFMDDPRHIAPLDGQRYVVLRASGAVKDEYVRIQAATKERLAGLEVSYPAQPHVTLLGLAEGTAVDAVRELVTDWASSVPPLVLEIEKVSIFPTPAQIVIVQLHKTPDLARAMTSVRAQARERGLSDLAKVSSADWVFHMSVAYCSAVSPASWTEVKRWIEALAVPSARVTVSAVEIVLFEERRESSGGVVALTGPKCRPIGQGAV